MTNTFKEHTETLIVEQLKTGNEDAYQYIYDRHYALLCHVANGYVKDQFLAETIVGDTIFHLWEIVKRWRFPFPSVAICREPSVIVVSTILIQNGKSARLRFHL